MLLGLNFNTFSFETFLWAIFLFKDRTGPVQTLLGGKSWPFKSILKVTNTFNVLCCLPYMSQVGSLIYPVSATLASFQFLF